MTSLCWRPPVRPGAQRSVTAAAPPDPLGVPNRRSLEALPEGGSILDVGCGAGAASLPLSSRAGELIGVDTSNEMLDAFRERAERGGVAVRTIAGHWPEVAAE